MKIKQFIDLIFCKFFDFAKLTGKDNLYHYTAICELAGLLTLNTITVYAYIRYLADGSKSHSILFFISIKAILILIFILLLLFYFIYIHKNKYKNIYERFKRESIYKGSNGSYITIFYVIFTILFLFSLAI